MHVKIDVQAVDATVESQELARHISSTLMEMQEALRNMVPINFTVDEAKALLQYGFPFAAENSHLGSAQEKLYRALNEHGRRHGP